MKNLFSQGLKHLAWGADVVPLSRFVCQIGSARISNFPLVFLWRQELSERTSRVMTTRRDFYIHDPKNICNIGDIVLAKKLDFFHAFPECWEAPSDWNLAGNEVWFELEKIMFKAGAVVDPLTGLKVDGNSLLSDEKYDRDVLNSEKLPEPARFFERDYLPPKNPRPWPLERNDTSSMVDESQPELEQRDMPVVYRKASKIIHKDFKRPRPPQTD